MYYFLPALFLSENMFWFPSSKLVLTETKIVFFKKKTMETMDTFGNSQWYWGMFSQGVPLPIPTLNASVGCAQAGFVTPKCKNSFDWN